MKKHSYQNQSNQLGKVKAFQDLNKEITENASLKNRQPTPQPKEIDEIEY